MKYIRDDMISKDFEVYHKKMKSLTDNPLHYHDFFEIYYHMKGDCDYIIDSRVYSLQPGDIVIIRSQKLHKALVKDLTSEYERYVLWMTNEFIGKLISDEEYKKIIYNREDNAELMRLPQKYSEKIRGVLDSLVEENSNSDALSKELQKNYLEEMLLLICKYSRKSSYIKEVEPKQDPLIKEIMEYLDQCLFEKTSLDEVADYFYMNKFHLIRVFKRHTQMTIMDYIKKKRLMVARNMIEEGEPIKEIYRACGFEDYSNFYKAFKSVYGMSPRDYRRYMQEYNHNTLSLQLDEGEFHSVH